MLSVNEDGTRHFWIGSGLGLCLSFMIREMKTTAMFGFTTASKKSACCLFVYDYARTGFASDKNFSSQVRKQVTLKLFYLLTAVFIFIIPFTVSPLALYLVQVLIGFSLGIIFPLLLGMSIESVSADMRATSTGHTRRFMNSVFSEDLWPRDFLMIGWGSEPDFILQGCSGWRLSSLLICGEPMRKNRRSITRHDFIFVYAFKKEEILFG